MPGDRDPVLAARCEQMLQRRESGSVADVHVLPTNEPGYTARAAFFKDTVTKDKTRRKQRDKINQ